MVKDQERGTPEATSQFNARFGARVKALREAHDPYLSQEAAAHRAGIAVSAWSRVEPGVQAVHPQRLMGIARALDVQVGTLFDGLDG